MSKIIYDPLGIFEQNESKGGVCEIKQALVASGGAVVNGTVVAATTGKKIRVLLARWSNISAGALQTNLVGTTATDTFSLATLEKYQISEPVNGLVETASGAALLWNATGASLQLYVRYIEIAA